MKITDPRVRAALARMEARDRTKREPIKWRTSERSHRCAWCKSKTALLLYEVRQVRRSPRSYGIGDHRVERPEERWSGLSARCVDAVACKARSSMAYEKRQRRSGNLRWAQSRFESPNLDLPKGNCRWCGEVIVYVEGVDYRVKRRERHRGDEHEVGDQNCRREHDRTFAANARELVQNRGDPCCVDCGDRNEKFVPNEDGGGGYWYETGEWEADHHLAIEDGGPHTPVNICRRCVPCHRAKTNAENRARAERRRAAKQAQLLAA